MSDGEYQTTSDVVIENFVSRRAAGEVFMNPFTVVKQKRVCSTNNFLFGTHPIWGSRRVEGKMACIWSVPPTRPVWFDQRKSDAQGRVLLRAYSKVASEDFLALVTVAEAAKTAKMLAKPFGAARDLVNRIAYRRTKLLRAGLTVGAASITAWLEYRFGWKPLLYDIQGIKEAYINNLVSHSKPVRLVARASDSDIIWDLPGSVTTGAWSYGIVATMKANYSHRAKVSAGVLYELKDDSLEQATARRMGLRLQDVPSSIWELVPFSFVVDRFLDVGVWLSAITPKPGVTVLASWLTTIDYQLNHHSVVNAKISVGTPPPTTYNVSGGSFTEEIQSINRQANPGVPSVPTVNYRDLNLVQQIDHLALTIALLTGLKIPKS
jgi:hypothetical protein